MKNYSLLNYFYFTRLERNAGIALCVLCGLSFCLPLAYPFLLKPAPKTDFTGARQMAAALVPATAQKKERSSSDGHFRGQANTSPEHARTVPFLFDPNTATKEELVQLGLSPRTAQSILNYRAKGGHFYKKEDLKRIYTLGKGDYERLEAFIQIPASEQASKYHYFSEKEENQAVATKAGYEGRPFTAKNHEKRVRMAMVDVNAATQEDWQLIRGIGPGWAKRIVNYREKLGGFASTAQVAETFGLPDSVYQKALPQLQFATGIFRKIKLNTATLDELKAHPYLSSFQATILFNYRVRHGSYADFSSVKKVKAGFTDDDWQRLEPYFSFE